ncbi:hypothetical protein QNM97_13910 [Gordonia sp. L191]|uniref:hypothetical protein n=1 Tax=Gordonia sp. L191 TaxID=2982699 RepID=UPI0024C07DCC|nr:hypothetical protein [Gordonia sp. L191]WHU45147.1 hypothetical protein QNM97_13910 [Gordonia sp. L191]
MPRKRMLWPGYFDSEQLATLTLPACRTFEGFWVFADDRGRMKYDPDQLWADVWIKRRRIDNISIDDVADHLEALVTNGQLCHYRVGGADFLHVISWDEHQKINHPTPSKLPPCERHQGQEWAKWWRADDTATDRWRQLEKRAKQTRNGGEAGPFSESLPESYVSRSGSDRENSEKPSLPAEMGYVSDSVSDSVSECRATTSQCSSVQFSSDQASSGGNVRQFTRPSQRDRKVMP